MASVAATVDIVVDPEFAALIPSLTPDERGLLEQSLLAEGCRDPLRVTPDGVLLDGHNRLAICREHNIPFSTSVVDVVDRDQAMLWIIENQLARRNLAAIDRIQLVARQEHLLREQAAARQATRSQLPQNSAEASQAMETREVAAKAAGVSHDTYTKGNKLLEHGAPELVEAVRAGRESIHAASVIAELRADEQKAVLAEGKVAETAKALSNRRTNSPGSDEWYTPDAYLDAARTVLGSIETDPASCESAQKRVRAKTYFVKAQDGLAQSWHGTVWLNPPYARGLISKFVDKLLAELDAGNVTAAILLTNNETEARWFQRAASVASYVSFPNKRIRFLRPHGKSSAPLQGQALFYFGPDGEQFAKVFGTFGLICAPLLLAAPDTNATEVEAR